MDLGIRFSTELSITFAEIELGQGNEGSDAVTEDFSFITDYEFKLPIATSHWPKAILFHPDSEGLCGRLPLSFLRGGIL